MFKVTYKNTTTGVFIINFEHISLFSGASIIDLEQVNVTWECSHEGSGNP